MPGVLQQWHQQQWQQQAARVQQWQQQQQAARVQQSGRVTEVFVRRNGHWVNPGWHTDTEK